jgi:hypothetical protein
MGSADGFVGPEALIVRLRPDAYPTFPVALVWNAGGADRAHPQRNPHLLDPELGIVSSVGGDGKERINAEGSEFGGGRARPRDRGCPLPSPTRSGRLTVAERFWAASWAVSRFTPSGSPTADATTATSRSRDPMLCAHTSLTSGRSASLDWTITD